MTKTIQPDDRESVELNIPDDVLFDLMLRAHQQDITLNQLVEQILREQIDRETDDVDRD